MYRFNTRISCLVQTCSSCFSSLSLCPDYDAVLSQFDPNLARIVFSYLPNKPAPYDPTYLDSRIEYAKLVWYAYFPSSKSLPVRKHSAFPLFSFFSMGGYHPPTHAPATVDQESVIRNVIQNYFNQSTTHAQRRRRSVDDVTYDDTIVWTEAGLNEANVTDTTFIPTTRRSLMRVWDMNRRVSKSWFAFVFENTEFDAQLGEGMRVRTLHDLCAVSQHILDKFHSDPHLHAQNTFSLASSIQLHARGDLYACADVTQQEVDAFFHDFLLCRPFLDTNFSVEYSFNASMPYACQVSAVIFQDALNFALDLDILRASDPLDSRLLTFLVDVEVSYEYFHTIVEYEERQKQFYFAHFDGKDVHEGSLRLSAMRFPVGESLKWEVFQSYIVSDIRWFILALALVVFVMFVYMVRFDLVIATLISIVAGFVLAYLAYFELYCNEFFPFINILALLILIAIGADDVFVFFDIFEQTRLAHPDISLQQMIGKTLHHAVTSVFVTSFTTAAAFFANSVSDITAIRAFGVFAATAVIFNFFVMVLVVPSVIVVSELLIRKCAPARWLRRALDPITGRGSAYFCGRKRNFPTRFLRRTWLLWILLLTVVGLCGMFIVFVKPRFELPITKNFQLFPQSDPLEHWDLSASAHFAFAESEQRHDQLVFFYTWGFKADDPGNHCDPNDKDWLGPVTFDRSFDFYVADSQLYLLEYCRETKAKWKKDDEVCVLEAFEQIAQFYCSQIQVSLYMPLCCSQLHVPFSEEQLDMCGPLFLYLYMDVHIKNVPKRRIFDHFIFELSEDPAQSNRLAGYVLAVTTDFVATYEYSAMKKHYDDVTVGFLKDMKSAPDSVSGGFVAFTDWFWFFDMQHSLATGTYYSIALSLVVAFVVMLLTSLNLVITIYAMLTISFAIASTVAVLVLLGWHLNIIESIIVSLGVGLSIDFAIHYGVAYRLSRQPTCQQRTAESFERVGSAVVMAALTTFLAGASMMPCHVLAYRKLGVFLMLVMTFAWCYATLFFQSICYMFGPIGLCCCKQRITLRSLFSRKPSIRADRVAPASDLVQLSSDVMLADDAPLLARSSNSDSDDDSAIVAFGEL